MKRIIRHIGNRTKSWYEGVCEDSEYCMNFIGKTFEWLFFLLLLYITYDAALKVAIWWKPDYVSIGDYLNVKLPQILIGLGGLCGIVWAFDILTPGSWIRKTSEDPHASAAVLCALILGASYILAR